MIDQMSLDDVSMYYSNCYFKVKDGTVMYASEFSRADGTTVFRGTNIRTGLPYGVFHPTLDFTYPELGYVNLSPYNKVVLLSKHLGRNHKKGFKIQDMRQHPLISTGFAPKKRIDVDKPGVYSIMFPKYPIKGEIPSLLFRDRINDSSYVALSKNFCLCTRKSYEDSSYNTILLYRSFIVGAYSKGHFILNEHNRFLSNILKKEIDYAKIVETV